MSVTDPEGAQSEAEVAVLMRRLAQRYIWWKEADEALKYPDQVIAQVMDIGTFEDAGLLERHLGPERLVQVLSAAEAGMFSPPSWHYWHYRLGLATGSEQVPPLPLRDFT
jgi:hypothetical protein